MRVALCLAGHLRTFEKNYSNLSKYFLDNYKPDIYLHTWSEIDRGVPFQLEKKIKQLYHPVKYSIEHPQKLNITPAIAKMNYGHYDMNGVLSMFYSIHKSINLIEQEYDIVIRFRGDVLLKDKWELIDFSNELILPVYGNFGGYNDQIAYGSFQNMKIYADAYNYIDQYCSDGYLFNPEVLLKNHLDKNNIIIKRQDINYDLVWYNGHIHNMKQKEIDFTIKKV